MGSNWPSEDGGEHERDLSRASSLCKGKERKEPKCYPEERTKSRSTTDMSYIL